MENKQQTAVEWLSEKLVEILGDKCNELSVEQTLRNHYAIQQALQMEREQIETAYWDGGQDVPINENRCAEYYEQTYGTEPSR